MIYMTTDEWKEIAKIIEEKDWKELSTEITSRTYDLDISEKELEVLIRGYTDKIKKDKKDKEEKRLWKIRRIGVDHYESAILELTESEAKRWLKNWPIIANSILELSYREGDGWVTYEITN